MRRVVSLIRQVRVQHQRRFGVGKEPLGQQDGVLLQLHVVVIPAPRRPEPPPFVRGRSPGVAEQLIERAR